MTITHSQNGWPVDPKVTRVFVGYDTNGLELRAGNVAKAATWFMQQFHDTVEPIVTANGYRTKAYNDSLSGSLPNSDHISATAWDLNGAKHPNEWAQRYSGKPYKSGFTPEQTAKIRALMKYAGIFQWGMDFPVKTRDAMHFAIGRGVTSAEVEAFVKKITPKPPVEDDMPTVKNYSTTVPQPIKDPTKWQTVKFTDEGGTSIASNPKGFTVDVKIRLSGVKVGDTIQARVYRVDAKDGATTVRTGTYDLVERPGTSGDTFIDLIQIGGEQKPDKPGFSNRIRVEIVVPTKGARITKATAKTMAW